MKQKKVFFMVVLLVMGVSLLFSGLVKQESAKELFERAVYLQETRGDLEGAIEVFQRVIKDFPNNRELASKALLQIGLCYDLLGEKKAEAIFRKLIADYPDQKDTVQIAKEKLALLSQKTAIPDSLPKKLTIREISGPDTDPDFVRPSPNGQYFAFIDWDRGGNLYLFDIKSGKSIPLTEYEQTSQSWCDCPTWSNDSRKIAYTYYNTQDQKEEVHILRLSDKKDEFVYEDSEKRVVDIAGWSPDQKKLYVDIQYKNFNRSLGYISIESGLLTEIEQLGRTIPYSTEVSPDGKYLAYDFRDESGNSDIRAISSDGKEKHILVKHAAKDFFLGWTSDGNHILFSTDRSGTNSIWLLPTRDGKSSGEPTRIHNLTGDFWGYGFTNSGAFYFSESHSEKDVYTAQVDLNTGKILKAPERIEKANQGRSRTPFWSQDGKYLGYFFKNNPSQSYSYSLKIRTLAIGKTQEIKLDISPSEYSQLPAWTKDGKYVLILGNKKYGEGSSLYRVDIESGQSHRISNTNRIHAFSHDASLIYRQEHIRTTDFRAWQSWIILRTEDGKEKEIIRSQIGSSIGSLSLSPDKKWLRFIMRKHTEKGNILSWNIMPAHGGDILDLTQISDMAGPFLWGPKENGVIIRKMSENTEDFELWYIRDFQKNDPLLKLDLVTQGIRDLSFHPDGQTIAFTGQTYTSKFWVMENFLPKTKDKK